MGRSRKGARKVPRGAKSKARRSGWEADFVGVDSVVAGLNPDEQLVVVKAAAAEAEGRFNVSAKILADTLAGCHPPRILTALGIHLLHLQGEGRERASPELRIHQHHLELLQAIALRAPLPAPSSSRVASSVTTVLAALQDNAEAFSMRGLKTRLDDPTMLDKRATLHQLRGDTQMVRGEFHAAQTERYLRAIAGRIDARFTAAYGVSATALADLQSGLLNLLEGKIEAWRRGLFRVTREGKPQRAIKAYVAAFEPGQEPEVRARITAARVPDIHVAAFLVEEAHLKLDEVYRFDLTEARALLPTDVTEAAARQILDAWSLSFGDLADHPFDHLHLANPVWTKPFIRLPCDAWLCPSPGTMITFAIAMVEALIDEVPELKTVYEDRVRGRVLEAELAQVVKAAFKGHPVFTRMKWTSDLDGRGYETDAFVLIGDTALIFEAKAGRISPLARRGADARLKTTLAKLIADPSEQSARLEEILTRRRELHTFDSDEGPAQIDSRQIDRCIRYNITFNNLGLLAASWPSLVKAGLIAADTPYAPTMSAADLEVVCELLEHSAEIVHYLRRRIEFETNAQFMADEYDLLAFYIASGFNIGTKEYGSTFLGLYGMSQTLDAWFSRRRPGMEPPAKPRQARTRLWIRMLATLAERQPRMWLEMSHRLLNIDYDVQAALEERLPIMRARILASKVSADVLVAKLHNPTIERANPAVVLVYKADTRQARDKMIQWAGQSFIEEIGAKDCLIISFNAHQWSDTYGEIGYMVRSDDPERRDFGAA
ncbi:MAG: hypothetical protein Q8Q88_07540 [Phenylobacterium sp.]|uniref:hypothetical protein n=1 Tax=Phenylobacterium sp. TaxID=1871053 RepID=UPI002735DE4B|nr:hypothetical protein [Phenylobacterium sp.]MDP3746889.1 hypothetical protein [Phenylobacterium sp.]